LRRRAGEPSEGRSGVFEVLAGEEAEENDEHEREKQDAGDVVRGRPHRDSLLRDPFFLSHPL
ncbi:MAG: hypothetical protein ACRD1Z_15940, partial [Vicinamibacteria bacterium]